MVAARDASWPGGRMESAFRTKLEVQFRAHNLACMIGRTGPMRFMRWLGNRRAISHRGATTMNSSILAAVAPLVVVFLAFTIGAFAARRERAQRTARTAAEQTNPRATAVA